MGVPHYILKGNFMIISFGGKEYVSGESYAAEDILAAYKQGLRNGKWEAEEKHNLEVAAEPQYHYDKGYEDGKSFGINLGKDDTVFQKQWVEKERKNAYGDGYVKGHNAGWRGAVKAYNFGKPNKETQETMQEVLHKDSNEFLGIWVAKDGSGKLKVINVNGGSCDVELVEYVSNYFICAGATATIEIDDLKEHWNKDELVNTEVKHNHYRKSVENLDYIDIYRVCKLFKVKDDSHCLHHSIKKLLMSGQRGAGKSKIQDITEARDSLNSYLENAEVFKGYSDD